MNKLMEVPKIEPFTGDRLKLIAKRHKIAYDKDESDEDIRERVIRMLRQRRDDERYKKEIGIIKLDLIHCEGCDELEYVIRF